MLRLGIKKDQLKRERFLKKKQAIAGTCRPGTEFCRMEIASYESFLPVGQKLPMEKKLKWLAMWHHDPSVKNAVETMAEYRQLKDKWIEKPFVMKWKSDPNFIDSDVLDLFETIEEDKLREEYEAKLDAEYEMMKEEQDGEDARRRRTEEGKEERHKEICDKISILMQKRDEVELEWAALAQERHKLWCRDSFVPSWEDDYCVECAQSVEDYRNDMFCS